ncbi:MAG: LPS assembly lipoprotein LptE [Leptospirales bacterium]
MIKKLLGYILFILIVIGGCASGQKDGKSVIDGGEIIPRNYKTIYIHNFENKTYEGGLSSLLKDYLILEFSTDGRFLIETEKESAELIVYGVIDLFSLQPRNIDQFGEAQSFNMTIISTVRARVQNAEEENYALPDLKIVRYDTTFSPRIAPFESRQVATDRLLSGLARRIHIAIVKGWYSELKTPEELGRD